MKYFFCIVILFLSACIFEVYASVEIWNESKETSIITIYYDRYVYDSLQGNPKAKESRYNFLKRNGETNTSFTIDTVRFAVIYQLPAKEKLSMMLIPEPQPNFLLIEAITIQSDSNKRMFPKQIFNSIFQKNANRTWIYSFK